MSAHCELLQQNKCDCKASILIVDDTEFNIIPVERMISNHFNIDVATASNGKIAVEMYRECLSKPCQCSLRAFKLILMDLSMPVMNGDKASSEILKLMRHSQLRNQQSSKKCEDEMTHIVAVTSHTNQKVKAKCLKLGMKAVYNKPVSLGDLRQIMSEHFFRK